jgi:DNA-binding beta-propeller fold protein YncE
MGCSDCVPENVYTSSVHWPTGVAVDVVNEMVYWADSLNHTIRRCSTAGPFPCSPEIVCQITAEPYGVAVDGVNNMLYWVVQDEGGSSGKIQRCSTAGSMPKDPQDFLTGLLKPLYIVLGG